jgi:hypothetical protein
MESNTNVAPQQEEEPQISTEHITEPLVSEKFVLSNSAEFAKPPPAAQPKTPPVQRVTFADEQPKSQPRKRSKNVEAFFQDIQDKEIDSAQYKKIKAQMDAELKEKIGLVAQINGYCDESTFPGVKERAKLKKAKYTEDDDVGTLRAAKIQLEQTLGRKSAKNVAIDYFTYLCGGLEKWQVGRFVGMDFTGLYEAAPEAVAGFDDEINELIIKYQWLFYQPPELRFVTKFVKLLGAIDYMNRNRVTAIPNADYSRVDVNTQERYADL